MNGPIAFSSDLLRGADEIAEFIFGSRNQRRKIFHLVETSRFPHFRLGSLICARRSVIMDWIEEQERRGKTGFRNAPSPNSSSDGKNGTGAADPNNKRPPN